MLWGRPAEVREERWSGDDSAVVVAGVAEGEPCAGEIPGLDTGGPCPATAATKSAIGFSIRLLWVVVSMIGGGLVAAPAMGVAEPMSHSTT